MNVEAGGRVKNEQEQVLVLRLLLSRIKEHDPQLLLSELRTFAALNGIDLIFMPLYAPDVQPIELIWALSKRFVRKNWFKEQILEQTAGQLFVSWYGGDVEKNGAVIPSA